MGYPTVRPRRLRRTETIRELVRETRLDPRKLVQPLFVCPGSGVVRAIASMPDCAQMSVDRVVEDCRGLSDLGLQNVILFGIPESKDPTGSGAVDDRGVVPEAVRAIKAALPGMLVWCDICLCEYTDHGHCGILKGETIDNDATLPRLTAMALACAKAGADVVAPSDMMDGRVAAIREALDAAAFESVAIMSYTAKYASSYYGPFREAAHSAPGFGDRRSHQMDARNRREAVLEASLDVEEGADILMVKPALAYLDVVAELRAAFPQPLAVYNVSGEYSMVKAAAARGWIDERAVVLENWHSFRRAGADIIITYHARQALAQGWL